MAAFAIKDVVRPNGDAAERPRQQGFAAGRLLTVAQVADLLQIPISWVYSRTRRRARDRIPGFRLGKYWRYREADVLTWLETQRS